MPQYLTVIGLLKLGYWLYPYALFVWGGHSGCLGSQRPQVTKCNIVTKNIWQSAHTAVNTHTPAHTHTSHTHTRPHTDTHTHTDTRTDTYTHARTHTLTHTHARTQTHTQTHTHTHTDTRTYTHTHTRTHARTHTLTDTRTRTHTHTHTHTPGAVSSQCCGAWGAVGGLVLAQGSHLSRGIEGGESAGHSKVWLQTYLH